MLQDTEDEWSRLGLKKAGSTGSEPLAMAMKVNVIEESESLNSLYIEMDKIEDELTKSDPLPFEGLKEKKQKLEVWFSGLLLKHFFPYIITFCESLKRLKMDVKLRI